MICIELLDNMTQMTNHFTIKTGCKKRQSSYSFDFQQLIKLIKNSRIIH
ncbi:hypothetical protein HMPREF9145_1572 [Segatella salivae F0493]|uniref:Uncharacterized protein n=1 Tax=Segatella salivae F0493 TaxID=1395125 RepID=U2LEU3_9BACT|nr:hypothetical protein HMPREF9145_1572 [Segatella salivae F0493]